MENKDIKKFVNKTYNEMMKQFDNSNEYQKFLVLIELNDLIKKEIYKMAEQYVIEKELKKNLTE